MPIPAIFQGLPDIFTGTFGQPVTLTLDGGEVRDVTAVFLNPSTLSVEVSLQEPQIGLREVDAGGLADDDLVSIDGVDYRARTISPDGRGMVLVSLEEV